MCLCRVHELSSREEINLLLTEVADMLAARTAPFINRGDQLVFLMFNLLIPRTG